MRDRRPVYVDLLPPCNAGCPAGENIQSWLAHVTAGRHEQAWRALVADNPLPAVHGRVCYHPCESACNRSHLDSAVSIHSVERFLGDLALERGWAFDAPAERSGRRVLVVGAGPSGLSAAYHLARLGHEVEVRDVGDAPGRDDALRHPGVPAPARRPGRGDRADRRSGRALHTRPPGRGPRRRAGGAAGSTPSSSPSAPTWPSASTSPQATPGASSTRSRSCAASPRASRPVIGRRVAVYGGGNTAMDAARVARRLGAQDAVVVYRRTRAQMPAHEDEAADAEKEGVRLNWLRTITAFDGSAAAGGGHGARRHGLPPAHRPVRDPVGRHRDPGAGSGDRVGVHGGPARGRVRARRLGARVADDDDRLPRRVRWRRHGAQRAHRHGGGRPRQEGGPAHRRLAAVDGA